MADFVEQEDETSLTAEELAKKLKKKKELEAGVIELGDEDSADEDEVRKDFSCEPREIHIARKH